MSSSLGGVWKIANVTCQSRGRGRLKIQDVREGNVEPGCQAKIGLLFPFFLHSGKRMVDGSNQGTLAQRPLKMIIEHVSFWGGWYYPSPTENL